MRAEVLIHCNPPHWRRWPKRTTCGLHSI